MSNNKFFEFRDNFYQFLISEELNSIDGFFKTLNLLRASPRITYLVEVYQEIIHLIKEHDVINQFEEGYEILYLDGKVEENFGLGFLEAFGVEFYTETEDSLVYFKLKNEVVFAPYTVFKSKLIELLGNFICLVKDEKLNRGAFKVFQFWGRQVEGLKLKKSPRILTTYLVRQVGTTKIKIGRSSKPKERINTISHQCGSHLETLILIPKDIEQELHLKFCYLRHLGEWFIDNGDILDWVEKHKLTVEV